MTEKEKKKLELYEEMRPFIERIFFAGVFLYHEDAERLVKRMDEIEE